MSLQLLAAAAYSTVPHQLLEVLRYIRVYLELVQLRWSVLQASKSVCLAGPGQTPDHWSHDEPAPCPPTTCCFVVFSCVVVLQAPYHPLEQASVSVITGFTRLGVAVCMVLYVVPRTHTLIV
jgi:hypothetical protein